ncbi:hydrogenase 4 subunit B [Mariprofundus sp. EBB-1]|uniref:hydrogenase 4 subunit B n=1 Tax=Mariprofundus sp. EBB-1 TaxID=2650971 RepID=UPI000EF250AF|nr:hydrogenase 4 subunit B [Mariprofundus sp. EBB-1]RLL51154.1 hydrogenase 4 subunit B [Mariprofundus sp. EBB-1]
MLSLNAALAACVFCTLATMIPVCCSRSCLQRTLLCLLLAITGLLACMAGLAGLLVGGGEFTLPLGLPWLPMHLRIDALSSFFLLLIGSLLLPVAIYSQGYLRGMANIAPLTVFMPLFVLGMLGVVLSDDAFTFMLFWEIMSVSSYFLVTFEHQHVENRKAGYIYLLMAHLAGLLILGSFAILYAASGSFEFAAMREAVISPLWAAIAFLLAGVGFGTKAGMVPMHGWLPEAHPVAPSNVSALMSGIMLKVAIFGFIRVVWDLMGPGDFQWWWGMLVLAAGSGSAVTGVLLALQQNDLKRLLAYSSIENIGIILIGLGLGMLLARFEYPMLSALALIGALYHAINHALFKGLLFMGAGAVLHSTGTRNMEVMGGLIHRMPWTAALFLVACIAIAGLPPFNGFVSEWLIFQSALMAPQLGGTMLSTMIPFSAAMLALAGALAAACFVKAFGVVFLGRSRSEAASHAHEVDHWMKLGMAIPALLCLLLGLSPVLVIPVLDAIPQLLLHTSLSDSVHAHGWLWLTPVGTGRASYSAPIILAGMLLLGGLTFWLLHPKGRTIRRSVMWSCGNPHLNARMQYNATAFTQPLRRIFSGIYQPEEQTHIARPFHTLLTQQVRYIVHIQDMMVQRLYQPVADYVLSLAKRLDRLHQQDIRAYLAYTFYTILFLLALLSIKQSIAAYHFVPLTQGNALSTQLSVTQPRLPVAGLVTGLAV